MLLGHLRHLACANVLDLLLSYGAGLVLVEDRFHRLEHVLVVLEFLPELDALFHEASSRVGVLLLSHIEIVVQGVLHVLKELFVLGAFYVEDLLGFPVDFVELLVDLCPCAK